MACDYFPLTLIEPGFSDPLTDAIIELDRLRHIELRGSTPPELFRQLKSLFHLLESIGSARIEGNRTTVAEMVDARMTGDNPDTSVQEILNIENALEFLDEYAQRGIERLRIDHSLVRHLHMLVTDGLPVDGEGAARPGEYRRGEVRIANARHTPPSADQVFPLLDELFKFYNRNDPPKYDLLKTALAHHRFAWIHPFSNGNGRTVRLLTYAMLLKCGFMIGRSGRPSRILNPTAIFCSDRDGYYDNLARADTGSKEDLLQWCRYVLSGLQEELTKIERLLDYEFLTRRIFIPAINELHRKNGLSDQQKTILLLAVEKQLIQNQEVRSVLGGIGTVQTSRLLSDLRDQKLLIPPEEAKRKYMIGIHQSTLTREVIRRLDAEGFLPLRNEI